MTEAALQNQSTSVQLARPLKILVPSIHDRIREAEQAGIPYYAAVGAELWEARSHFDASRSFMEWATKTFRRGQGTIKSWMQYAKKINGDQPLKFQQVIDGQRASRPQPKHFPTLSQVSDPNRNPRHAPDWYAPVQEITGRVDIPRMTQERQDRQKEKELLHRLGLQLIDIGYKVLAAKLHPDKVGGSREAMQRLNEVRNILKGAI